MSSRWWTVGVAACLAGSAAFWGLRLAVRPAPVPAGAQVAQAAVPMRGDLSRLLGQEAAPPSAASNEPPPDARFQLLGVLAPRAGEAGGIALIAVDGKPPRAVRVGQVVDGQQVLKQVSARGAQLGPADGAVTVSLAAPGLPAATTGVLPNAGGAPAGAVPPTGGLPATEFVAPGVFPGLRNNMRTPGAPVVMQGGTQPVAQPLRAPEEPSGPAVQRPRPMVPPPVAAQQQATPSPSAQRPGELATR